MLNGTLTFTDAQLTKLKAAHACDSYIKGDTFEAYCKNVLLAHAESILEPSSDVPKMICPLCHEITEFAFGCEKCHGIFHEAETVD